MCNCIIMHAGLGFHCTSKTALMCIYINTVYPYNYYNMFTGSFEYRWFQFSLWCSVINYEAFIIVIWHKCVYCSTTVVPHVTDAIQEWVQRVARIPVDGSGMTPQVCVIEVRVITCTAYISQWVELQLYRWRYTDIVKFHVQSCRT